MTVYTVGPPVSIAGWRSGIMVDETATTSETIYQRGKERLARLQKPAVSYTVKLSDLSKLRGNTAYESFAVGDIVDVVDDDLGIVTQTRVISLKRSLGDWSKTEIGIGNYAGNESSGQGEAVTAVLESQPMSGEDYLADAYRAARDTHESMHDIPADVITGGHTHANLPTLDLIPDVDTGNEPAGDVLTVIDGPDLEWRAGGADATVGYPVGFAGNY
ncbi:MAG: phage tail spike protein [Patescibacteria group bacterium]